MTLLQDASAPAAAAVPTWRRWVALVAMSTAQLIVVLDSMIMLVALPTMQRDIGISQADGQWVLTAYALAIGGLLLLGGRVADYGGRRRAFLLGLLGFTAASALGGAAVNTAMLLVARVLQGAFAALLMPAALSLLSVMFVTPKDRARALAVWSAVGASGMSLGLVLGGVLSDYASWRWCLLINVPIGLVALVAGAVTIPESRIVGRPRYDLLGTVSGSLGLFLLVYGLARAGTDGWSDPLTVGSLVGSVVVLGAFLAIEQRVPDPLMPLHLLVHRSRGGAFIGAFGMFCLIAMWLFLIYFLQNVRGYSAVEAGLTLVPYSVVLCVTAALLNQRIALANQRFVISGGLIVAACGAAVLGFVDPGWTMWTIMAITAPLGVGLISAFIGMSGTILADTADDERGVVSALFNVMQQIGTAFGASLLTTVAVERTESVADGVPTPADLAEGYGWACWGAGALVLVAALLAVVLVEGHPGEPEPVDAPRPGVSGVVSAVGGLPVPGVPLTLLDWSGREVARTTSDATGRYHLEVPDRSEYLLVASPAGHAPAATPVHSGHAQDLRLVPERPPATSHPVVGTVRSADTGRGIPGAMVSLIAADGTRVASTDTRSDGTFRFDDVPPGGYTVTTTFHREVSGTLDVPGEAALITLDRLVAAP